MKVLVTDTISEKGIELLKKTGFGVDLKTGLDAQRLIETVPGYDAMIVRSSVKVTKGVIDAAKGLKVIVRAGVGTDNIDITAATEKGIVVMNTPFGNTVSAAEHTVAFIIMLAKQILHGHLSMKKGEWERKRFKGIELAGKSLGIIGLGRVGVLVAKAANGLSMEVIAVDPYAKEEDARQLGVRMVPFDELVKTADFITVHVPLTPKTKYLLGREQFAMMKKGARIVNVARGGVIDEEALYDALVSGRVAAAAIDVWENEPPGQHKLLELEQVIATPHLGASTEEAQEKVGLHAAEQIVDMLKNNNIRNAVNRP